MVAAGRAPVHASETDRMRGMARIAIGLRIDAAGARSTSTATAAPLARVRHFPFRCSPGSRASRCLVSSPRALVTWLAHSSLTIVLLAMSLVAVGALPMPLALRARARRQCRRRNRALLALSGSPPAGRRVALGNLLMRRGRVALPVPVRAVASRCAMTLDRSPRPRVPWSNFHTGFNLVVAAIFLPLVGLVGEARRAADPRPRGGAGRGRRRAISIPTCSTQPSEALACAMRRDAAHGRPRRRHAATVAGRVREIRSEADAGSRESRQRGRRAARGDQALPGQGLPGRDERGGEPAATSRSSPSPPISSMSATSSTRT